MLIQINTDHNIAGHEELSSWVRGTVETGLSRLSEHITRVEVHLTDENSDKNGADDKRCLMEARLEGRSPVAVTHHAETFRQAADGATGKLIRVIDGTLERMRDKARRASPESP